MDLIFVAKRLRRDWPDIERLRESDVDAQCHRFRGGVNNWIVQSYLRLRAPLERNGVRVRISNSFVANAICVAHRDDLNFYLDFCEQAYIMGVRADRPPLLVGDRQIVQNALNGRERTARYLPFWPQPGLIPRDARRGERITRIAYFGRDSSAPSWFREPDFHSALRNLGVEFHICTDDWHDYSNVDLILAHRLESPTMLLQKPASKLINAWHAGVPALLSREPAFTALRRSPLDYLEIDTPQSVLQHVERLQADRRTYLLMIDNGRQRARDFSVDAVRARWVDLIFGDVIPDFLLNGCHSMSSMLRFSSFAWRLTQQKFAAKRFRWQAASELSAMERGTALPQANTRTAPAKDFLVQGCLAQEGVDGVSIAN